MRLRGEAARDLSRPQGLTWSPDHIYSQLRKFIVCHVICRSLVHARASVLPALLLASSVGLAQQFVLPEVAQFLPAGEYVGTLVSPDLPEPLRDPAARMEKAMKEHPSELLAALLEAHDGPLPYQPWLNISKADYEAILHAKRVLTPLAKGTLTVNKVAGDGSVVRLNAKGVLADLNGLEINYRKNTVRFPAGESVAGEDLNVKDQDGLGPRFGRLWTYRHEEWMASGRLVILKLNDSGKILVNYQYKSLLDADTQDGLIKNVDLTLTLEH